MPIHALAVSLCRRACAGTFFSLISAPSHGAPGPPSNTCFLGPTRVHNSNSISLDRFSLLTQMTVYRVSLYFTMRRPSPSKLFLPMGGSGPHLIHGYLCTPESSNQTASRSIKPFCRAQYSVTDRQTDRSTNRQTKLLGR